MAKRACHGRRFKEALLIWDMRSLNEAQINLLMGHFDDDGDGCISYDEFLVHVRGTKRGSLPPPPLYGLEFRTLGL